MLTHSAPEHGVRHQNDFVDKSEKTWKFSKELFKYLFKTQELYLVEGDCILPKQIAELQVDYPQEIKSCFMGYTTLTAKQKLDLVRMYNKGEEDWTNKHDEKAQHDGPPEHQAQGAQGAAGNAGRRHHAGQDH